MDDQLVDILLVEDNEIDAELTIFELRKNNILGNLHHLKNGEEALHFFFRHRQIEGNDVRMPKPKLILLDIQMPKVNGLEVLKRIKTDDRTKSLPVVIFTSSKEHSDIERAYELGANSYVVKPLQFEDFQASIKQLGHYWIYLNQFLM